MTRYSIVDCEDRLVYGNLRLGAVRRLCVLMNERRWAGYPFRVRRAHEAD